MQLTSAQRTALEHVAGLGPDLEDRSEDLRGRLKVGGRIQLAFHPDRLAGDGSMVADSLLRTGEYRSQFLTGLSAGSYSPHSGGERFQFEHRLFGGAYDTAAPSERPVYGALDLFGHVDGAAPRFGSCWFVLADEVWSRCTFTVGDSHVERRALGTADRFGAVAAAIEAQFPSAPSKRQGAGRLLDDYVEVQIHGGVRLDADVVAMVADRSFAGTRVGSAIMEAARRYDFELRWRRGPLLDVRRIDESFRGPEMLTLGMRVSAEFGDGSGVLTAALIGSAARDMVEQPRSWESASDGRPPLQLIKQLWHCAVQYGDYPTLEQTL